MPYNGDTLPGYFDQILNPYPDEYPLVKLVFGGNEVWLFDFEEGGGYRREIPKGGEVSYSLAGTPKIDHVSYLEKYFWTISAYCPTQGRDLFWKIINDSSKALKTPPYTNYGIKLHDIARTIIEDTQTRANASGTWQDTVGGAIAYFAQFNVLITKNAISEEEMGLNLWKITFTASELTKVLP